MQNWMNFAAFLRYILCLLNLLSNARVDDITKLIRFSLLILKNEYLENKTRY